MIGLRLSSTEATGPAWAKLRWVRALLVPIIKEHTVVNFLRWIRGLFGIGTLLAAFITAILTAGTEGALWFAYGENLAMLLCLAYFGLAVWLSYAADTPYDADVALPTPVPPMAYVTWAMHTVALTSIYTALILYAQYSPRPNGHTLGALIAITVFMTIDFLISNTPVFLPFSLWTNLGLTNVAINIYVMLLVLYEALTAQRVYPTLLGFTNIITLTVFYGVVHLLLVCVQEARNAVLRACKLDVPLWVVPAPNGAGGVPLAAP